MRAVCVALAAALFLAADQGRPASEPFVPVGVRYGGGKVRAPMLSPNPARERDAWRSDLATIRSLGFNSIRTWIDWASAEPARGEYRFDALDQLLALAGDAGLRIVIQLTPTRHRNGSGDGIRMRASSLIRDRASDRRRRQ